MSEKDGKEPEAGGHGSQQPMHPHGTGYPAGHDHGGTGAQHANHLPHFLGEGAGTSVELDGVRATLLPIGKEVARAAQAITTGDLVVVPGAYEAQTTAVEGEIGDSAKLRRFAADALFRATGPRNDWAKNLSASLDPINPEEAFAYVFGIIQAHDELDAPPPPKGGKPLPQQTADRKTFEKNTHLLVDTMLHEKGFELLYKAHWDNSDDTSIDGLVAISRATGRVRVLSLWMPA